MEGKYKLGGEWSFWECYKPIWKKGGQGGKSQGQFSKNDLDHQYKNNQSDILQEVVSFNNLADFYQIWTKSKLSEPSLLFTDTKNTKERL